jgi:transposase
MEVLFPRSSGVDGHKREVVACLVRTEPDGTMRKEVRAFGTTTPDILALADWLAAHGVTHVAMESTGV